MLLLNKSIDVDFDIPSDVFMMTYSAVLKADNIATNLKIETDVNSLMSTIKTFSQDKSMSLNLGMLR